MKDNVIDKSRDAVSKIYSYANTNKQQVVKTIINTILIIIIFAIFGCFDFVNMSFDINRCFTPSFWTNVLTKGVAGGICAYNLSVNLFWDRDIEKNVKFRENAEKYERLLKLKDDTTFRRFVCDIYNRNEKVKTYKSYINRQKWKCDLFAHRKDKELYLNDKVSNEEKCLKSRYCAKRLELDRVSTDEYINENIDIIQIKYRAIDPLAFDKGLDGQPTKYAGTKINGSVALVRTSKTSTGLLGMLLVTAFITSIAVDPNQQQFASQMEKFWHYVLHIGADIGVIGWQVFRGMLASPQIIDEALVDPLVARNKVLTEYVNWCATEKVEKSKAFEIYNKIVESEKGVSA